LVWEKIDAKAGDDRKTQNVVVVNAKGVSQLENFDP